MSKSWTGPLVTALIVVGVAAILVVNFQPGRTDGLFTSTPPPVEKKKNSPKTAEAPVRDSGEKPIGDPVFKNHLQVTAVWLSAVKMDGMEGTSSGAADLIHLEADIRSLEDNPNGFGKDEFIPYLKVAYSIVPAQGGPAIDKGELTPMVAGDGLHYGANILMPKAGDYRLIYAIQPPSAGGLGRHSDPATGVAPWWEPFQAAFEWTIEPNSLSAALAGSSQPVK